MTIAIMQPYFFPYIGYFQLINEVDEFVIYDNIEFAKKGWINRNRILVNGKDAYITVPLKKDSDYLDVKERYLADTWARERKKILNKIAESYRKAPFFKAIYPVIEQVIMYECDNLFNFIFYSLKIVTKHLGINTNIVVSSEVDIDHSLKAEQKVIAICKAREAKHYLNPIGGIMLYDKSTFLKEHIQISFLQATPFSYKQFDNEFVPWLSIIDVMMFNSSDEISRLLKLNTLQ
jgi:hypothetical protein